jgi:hypothetical protein
VTGRTPLPKWLPRWGGSAKNKLAITPKSKIAISPGKLLQPIDLKFNQFSTLEDILTFQ